MSSWLHVSCRKRMLVFTLSQLVLVVRWWAGMRPNREENGEMIEGRKYGDTANNSQLQSPGFSPDHWLISGLCRVSVHVYPVIMWVSSGFCSFLPQSKTMQGGRLDTPNCPLFVKVCMHGALKWI